MSSTTAASTLAETPVVRRQGPLLFADNKRVILRRLYPGSHDKARVIVDRILALSEADIDKELSIILDDWKDRHIGLEHNFRHRCREVMLNLNYSPNCSTNAKLLIGAYFYSEYSVESAASFNPSIVLHPNQSDLPDHGCIRFIMSLRATGEGHISSVTFREGIIHKNCRVSLVPTDPRISAARRLDDTINRDRFVYEVQSTHGLTRTWGEGSAQIFEKIVKELPETFVIDNLRHACSHILKELPQDKLTIADTTVQGLLMMAEANYSVQFEKNSRMSQRVLFPSAPSQSNGIEDARFVLFHYPDGKKVYYATFTAYNGRAALPQLIETSDFNTVRFIVLSGNAITNKGMALFPRKVNGKFWMLSRQDDENVMIMESDSLLQWDNPKVLMEPQQPWEMFKMGNCGSPLETPKGWLVLTHGVGPMRRYCIGAAMLDLNDPTKVIGRMKNPLIAPTETEREGYVPNVVYSCGAIIHNNKDVLIPYAMSDSATSFASVSLDEIYAAMKM